MRLCRILPLAAAAWLLSATASIADVAPPDSATARILAEADSIRARQATEAAILARADSIRARPNPDSAAFRQLQYESRKKSPAVGLGLGLLLPGLGNFYSGDPAGGAVLLGIGITGVILASSSDLGTADVGSGVLLLTFIASPIGGVLSANDHNQELRKQLGLQVATTPGGKPALAITFSY